MPNLEPKSHIYPRAPNPFAFTDQSVPEGDLGPLCVVHSAEASALTRSGGKYIVLWNIIMQLAMLAAYASCSPRPRRPNSDISFSYQLEVSNSFFSLPRSAPSPPPFAAHVSTVPN